MSTDGACTQWEAQFFNARTKVTDDGIRMSMYEWRGHYIMRPRLPLTMVAGVIKSVSGTCKRDDEISSKKIKFSLIRAAHIPSHELGQFR